MTARISVMQDVEVPTDIPLVTVNEGGILIWPAGAGMGPNMWLDFEDWPVIRNQVEAAVRLYRNQQARGNN